MPLAANAIGSEENGLLPLPSTDVVIRDDYDRELPPGRDGEICVRGPQVMQGYWGHSQDTKNVLSVDGWLRTGDIGVIDEQGYLRITDRKKDMIIVSGFNVYPTDVEAVIAEIPGVLECRVVGVPDEKMDEAVKAFVVRKDPALSAGVIIAFCRERLTNYKVPKLIEFRDELPKSPIGKVIRRELRQHMTASAGSIH